MVKLDKFQQLSRGNISLAVAKIPLRKLQHPYFLFAKNDFITEPLTNIYITIDKKNYNAYNLLFFAYLMKFDNFTDKQLLDENHLTKIKFNYLSVISIEDSKSLLKKLNFKYFTFNNINDLISDLEEGLTLEQIDEYQTEMYKSETPDYDQIQADESEFYKDIYLHEEGRDDLRDFPS